MEFKLNWIHILTVAANCVFFALFCYCIFDPVISFVSADTYYTKTNRMEVDNYSELQQMYRLTLCKDDWFNVTRALNLGVKMEFLQDFIRYLEGSALSARVEENLTRLLERINHPDIVSAIFAAVSPVDGLYSRCDPADGLSLIPSFGFCCILQPTEVTTSVAEYRLPMESLKAFNKMAPDVAVTPYVFPRGTIISKEDVVGFDLGIMDAMNAFKKLKVHEVAEQILSKRNCQKTPKNTKLPSDVHRKYFSLANQSPAQKRWKNVAGDHGAGFLAEEFGWKKFCEVWSLSMLQPPVIQTPTEAVDENIFYLSVLWPEIAVIMEEDYYTIETLMSYIGGIIDLWLGTSILDILLILLNMIKDRLEFNTTVRAINIAGTEA